MTYEYHLKFNMTDLIMVLEATLGAAGYIVKDTIIEILNELQKCGEKECSKNQ
jgi:hypothetical protein